MSFVLTDRCNSLCKTCNIGRRYLDDPSVAEGELSSDEWSTVFSTIGQPTWVTLSGGEPFMRKDLADIVLSLLQAARPRYVNLPTNGTFVHATRSALERIAPALGDTRLVVNFSVDGAGRAHDELRGFDGNAERLLEAVAAVRALQSAQIVVGVNTTISRYNAGSIDDVLAWVDDHIAPDSHVLEVAQVRPEYHNEGAVLVDVPAVRRALSRARRRPSRARRHGVAHVIHAFRQSYYRRQERELTEPRPHRCYAGYATCTIMPKGAVWTNTSRADPMGNVRDFQLDFEKLWRSAAAARARDLVRADACVCSSSNASYTNSLMSPATMTRVAFDWARRP